MLKVESPILKVLVALAAIVIILAGVKVASENCGTVFIIAFYCYHLLADHPLYD